jgi:hypothetical protein
MYRPLLLVAIVLTAAGCHVPMPKFQPFAGAGSPRVPPPATGSYGKADSYYNNTPAAAQSTAPAEDAQPAILADSGGWRTPELPIGSGVMPASTASGVGASISRDQLAAPQGNPSSARSGSTTSGAQQATFIESQPARSSSAPTTTSPLSLNGMKVNDATRRSEPQRFVATGNVIEISQLPRAASVVASAAGASTIGSSTTAGASSTVTSSPTATHTLSADGWRSKYVPFSGVATR